MNRLLKTAMLGAVTAMLIGLPIQITAQQGGGGGGGGGRGNFDPAQMRQQRMDQLKEQLGVKGDDEWKAIESRITKVMDAQREARSGAMRGMFGARRGGGADQADQGANRRNNFGPQPSAAAEDLRKAIESGASADTIKDKLAAYRDEHKAKQEKLEQAQADLKKILTPKQEAAAVLAGLLD